MTAATAVVGLHHVQLAAPRGSEPRLRAFYGGVLGLTELAKPASLATRGGAWFQCGELAIHVGIEEDFRPARKAHVAILVRDLGGWRSRLEEHGHQVRVDTELPGFCRFYVDDPVGNRLELLEPCARP
jgi:catechol 2,3-dioxygenase-like lactoylglutathione lyase family enzyme